MSINRARNEWNYNTKISYIDSDHEQEIMNNEEAETLLGDPPFQNSQVGMPTIVNVGSISSRGSAQSIFGGNMNKSILPQSLTSQVAPKPFNSLIPPGSKI